MWLVATILDSLRLDQEFLEYRGEKYLHGQGDLEKAP